jgi:hypothetical protein
MSAEEARKQPALLVDSDYPLINLETWEEVRATEILAQVANELLLPLYVRTAPRSHSRDDRFEGL